MVWRIDRCPSPLESAETLTHMNDLDSAGWIGWCADELGRVSRDHSVRPPPQSDTTNPAGRCVREGDIDDEFQAAVLRLDEQMAVAAELQAQGVKAASEVLISVGRLLRHASVRIADFFSHCLHRLGREMANLGILQQSALLGRKALFAIVAKYDRDRASLFRRDYIVSALAFYHQRYVEASSSLALKGTIPLPPTPLIGDIQQPGGTASCP